MTDLPTPPAAERRPVRTTLHGDERVDDYTWLREKGSPEVTAYLEAENAYAEATLAPLKPLAEHLFHEMRSRIKEDDDTVPYRRGDWFYYSRTEKDRQYPIFCRKFRSVEAPEQVTLDVNELAEGKPFMSIGAYSVSDDGRYLAYSTDETGFRQYTLRVKDLETGELLPDSIERVVTVCWAADNATLVYAIEDEVAKRPYRVLRHRLGEATDASDVVIYEETDEMFRAYCWRTRSRDYIVVTSDSHTTSELRYLRSGEPGGEPVLISPRRQDHEYDLDHHRGESGEWFYVRTNDRGRNFRIVRVPVATPGEENWEEVVPQRDEVMLNHVDVFAGHLVLSGREGGLPLFEVRDIPSGEPHRVTFPDAAYEASLENNPEFDTATMRFRYESPVRPASVFDYDMVSRERTLLKQQEVPGGFDPARYVVERLEATAADGTGIPITLVRRKEDAANGTGALHLLGYGAYGYPYPLSFSSARFSLVDRGVGFAFAHIRGGGELGKRWHDASRMQNKMNTFTDFISCADYLVGKGYCSRDRLVIEGRSAGGLLMGAVLNLRPDVAKAAVLGVPFVDVINTMLDDSLPLTVGEWEEWGNPNVEEQSRWIKEYCPYTNLGARPYPSLFVRTALNDSQVMYWEPAKYVAKLRVLSPETECLFLTNMDAGHGGASGRYDYLEEVGLDYAFILDQVRAVER